MSSSPWGKAAVVAPCSLEDIMTEQLAVQLQKEDDSSPQTPSVKPFVHLQEEADLVAGAAYEGISPEDMAAILEAQGLGAAAEGQDQTFGQGQGQGQVEETMDDEMIARMMQLQFDREHNAMLDREASKLNGSSKVRLSFDNYKTQHPVQYEDESDSDEDIDEPVSKWEEKTPKIGSKGYVGSGKNITTKHDKVICGRKNAERLMAFPPEFGSGDGEGIDMQLTNKVYNKLKNHSRSEQKHRARETESKDHSTAVKSVDPKTRMMLFKLVSSGLLESLGGCIAEGKESTVFEGKGGSDEEVPDKVVVKVFKTTLTDFRTREKYVNGDHRFSSTYKKQHLRKIIKLWAMKEVANLNRLQRHDVPCPSVVVLRKHVLVMSMIGGDKPAPKLRYVPLSTADMYDAYEQTVQIMKDLHQKCGLVHADLSPYNLLWHAGKVHVIDVSQSVELTHPNALQFLLRDCTNISTYFQKQRLHGVLSPEELFNEVTGLDFQGEGGDFKAQVQRYDREKKEWNIVLEQSDAQFGFDYFFDKATAERESQSQSQRLQEDEAGTAVTASTTTTTTSTSGALSASPTSTLQASHTSLKAIVQKYVQESDDDSSSEDDDDHVVDDGADQREESDSHPAVVDSNVPFEEGSI